MSVLIVIVIYRHLFKQMQMLTALLGRTVLCVCGANNVSKWCTDMKKVLKINNVIDPIRR